MSVMSNSQDHVCSQRRRCVFRGELRRRRWLRSFTFLDYYKLNCIYHVFRSLPSLCAFLRCHGQFSRFLYSIWLGLTTSLGLHRSHRLHLCVFWLFFGPRIPSKAIANRDGIARFVLQALVQGSWLTLLCRYPLDSPTPLLSYGTAKSGVGISAMSVLRPDMMMKCSIPVVMAGIIAVSPMFLCTPVTHPNST